MDKTYEPITTQTLGTTTASVTFGSIPQTYTDLVLVCFANYATGAAVGSIQLQFNGDTASNYSWIYMSGTGSSAVSGVGNNASVAVGGSGGSSSGGYFGTGITEIYNYSNTTTYKSVLARADADNGAQAWCSMWRNTNAISSILIYGPYSFASNSTFTLYGIKAA